MQEIVTGIVAFSSTNIDDIFVLMAFFSQINQGTMQVKTIVIGQYVGIIVLTILSIIGALGIFFIPASWIGFLGLIPLYIGIKGLFQLNKVEEVEEIQLNISSNLTNEGRGLFGSSTFKVAAITIGNGGDNIAIYIPLFASGNFLSGIIIFIVFMILVGVWCYLGYMLVRHRMMAVLIKKYGRVIVPFVFIGLGIFIMYHSGTFNLLL